MVRIVIVEDHPIMRRGIAAALNDEPDFEVVGQYATAPAALDGLRRDRPGVVVFDYQLPGMTGVQACVTARARYPDCKVLILTSYTNETTLLAAFGAGAHGFVIKGSDTAGLRQAVRHAVAGGTYIDPGVAGQLVSLVLAGRRASGPFGLSVQERRVLERLPGGGSNAEIARQLGLSPETVKSHLSHAMRKLGVPDRQAAAAFVRRRGLG